MQYELYIDLFFLENFMMDYILLLLLKKMLACSVTHTRIIFGSAVGAAVTCAVIAAPIPFMFVKLLLFHCIVNVMMLKIGLRIEWGRPIVKAFLFLYIGGFLLGGIINFLHQYVRIGSLFFVLSLLGYLFASGIWSLIEALIRYNRTHCEALLYREGRSCRIKALVDTGNRLRDSKTGKPVSVIEPETAKILGFSETLDESEKLRYISYHSVGNANGALPLFEIDRMCLSGAGDTLEVHKPLLAVGGEEMGLDGYGIILNPDIYTQGAPFHACP
ncbi:MAG: sigma-E processing peptidase SpoIIGA [Dorea sp.]|nr:sigma-E processing peptidase SpoIIGA [Dorea sp.]